jgi:hypothetical protein
MDKNISKYIKFSEDEHVSIMDKADRLANTIKVTL